MKIIIDKGTVYFRKSYVGWDPGCPGLDDFLCRFYGISEEAVKGRRERYQPKNDEPQLGTLHVTLVTPPEVKYLKKTVWSDGFDLERLFPLEKTGPCQVDADHAIVQTYRLDTDPGVRMRSWLIPVTWPLVNEIREALGLPRANLHFTLGLERLTDAQP